MKPKTEYTDQKETDVGQEPTITPDTSISKRDSDVKIVETPLTQIINAKPTSDNSDSAPVLQQFNADSEQAESNNEYEEIPEEVCAQLYATGMEIAFTLKHKDMPLKGIPEERKKTQGAIIYGIMVKNQISIKHIDLFMLGAGMIGDWKVLCSDLPIENSEGGMDANE